MLARPMLKHSKNSLSLRLLSMYKYEIASRREQTVSEMGAAHEGIGRSRCAADAVACSGFGRYRAGAFAIGL